MSRLLTKRGKTSDSSYSNKSKSTYASLEDSTAAGQRTHELAPMKSMKTYIHGTHSNDAEEDGIHLRYDIEQVSHNVNH